jgi:uncharacterized protein (TIGR03437 family)
VYFYRVLVDGEDLTPEEELRFETANRGSLCNFLVFGDSGMNNPGRNQLAQLMGRERPALVLHTGDIAYYNGSFEQFQNEYFIPYAAMMRHAPFFPSPGNHDYETQDAAPYLTLHALPADEVRSGDRGRYYSFDWGNCHFVALDSNLPLYQAARGEGPMLQWLEADLARTRQFWKVVYFHHPPYASGPNENDTLTALARQHIVPILDRYGVQVVFNGHEHSYQQSRPLLGGQIVEPGRGTVYITSGGGGAHLYSVYPRPTIAYGESAHHYVRAEVRGAQMTLRVFRVDGVEIDTVPLTPLPVLATENFVVDAASFAPRLAPGSLVSIFGRNLSGEESRASSTPLPKDLGGVTIRVNGQRLPLLFTSAHQVNAQLTYDSTGEVTMEVTTRNGVIERRLTIAETAPALFPSASLAHADGRLITPEAPAQPGETILIYLTGLGRVTGDVTAGQATPAGLFPARAAVQVLVGSQEVRPMFAGLSPGFVGLYQINLTLPAGLSSGPHALRVTAGGATSNAVTLAVA